MTDTIAAGCKIEGHVYCVICSSDRIAEAGKVLVRWANDERLNFDAVAWSMMMVSLKEKRDG